MVHLLRVTCNVSTHHNKTKQAIQCQSHDETTIFEALNGVSHHDKFLQQDVEDLVLDIRARFSL